jgi:[ribosomal protein S18]-alanine N-acetyltransferase
MEVRDLAAVLEVERISVEAPQWGEALWRKLLEDKSTRLRRLVVAEAELGIVGYVVTGGVAETAEIESVAVDATARRQGIGKALCCDAMRWAAAQGAVTMELEVRASSKVAQRMYASLGFIEQGTRRAYYEAPSEDAVLMAAMLTGREF